MRPSRSAHSLALIEQRIADSNNLSQANRLADCYPIAELPSIFAARKASVALAGKLVSELGHAKAEEGTLQLAPEHAQDIKLQDVFFAYEEGNPVLRGITAEFEAGKCYTVVGASGSGKSTLLSLLMGARRDYEGKVTFDGSEFHDVSLDSLYGTESLVSQKTFLFDASLKDNITMFGDADAEALSSAIEQAGLKDFVAAHGLDYACGEEGANLSGGERQRVCIARALLHGARTLLFDEATSALDQKTADQVTRAVLSLSGTTRVMVTHRLDFSEALMASWCSGTARSARRARSTSSWQSLRVTSMPSIRSASERELTQERSATGAAAPVALLLYDP